MLNSTQSVLSGGAGSVHGSAPSKNNECTIGVNTIRCCRMNWFSSRRSCGKCGRNFHPPVRPEGGWPQRDWLKVEPPSLPDLATRLRVIRNKRGLTQQRLADLMGTSRTIICRYEARVVYPETHSVERMAKALDVSVNDLLEPDPILRELMRKRLHPDKRREILEQVRSMAHA